MEYRVTWIIDLDADSPQEAARQALAIHRDPHSLATIFDVTNPQGDSVLVDAEQLPDPATPNEPAACDTGHTASLTGA